MTNQKNPAKIGASLSFLQVQALRVSLKIFPVQIIILIPDPVPENF